MQISEGVDVPQDVVALSDPEEKLLRGAPRKRICLSVAADGAKVAQDEEPSGTWSCVALQGARCGCRAHSNKQDTLGPTCHPE
jgi:hypothetical protein